MTSVTDLSGVYARIATAAGDDELRRVIAGLRCEPEPRHPHITQALAAFTQEARRRGLED